MDSSNLIYKSYVFPERPEISRLLAGLPSVTHALFAEGVPKSFIGRRYTADSELTPLETEGSKRILRFGSSGLADAVVIDLVSGHVLEIVNAPHPVSVFINTSLGQFTRTVRAVISRFPYYDNDSDEDEISGVANELTDIVRSIDPEAVVPDRYWSTFIDDVEIGDLSTEAILAAIS